MSNAELLLAIISILITKGVPAVYSLLDNWKKVDPTLEDWDALALLIKDPESY